MSFNSDNPNILSGGPDPPNWIGNEKSMGEYCLNKFKSLGSTSLLIDGYTGERLSAIDLIERSIRLAQSLRKLGIREGDKVGICCENRMEFLYVVYGTLYLGATLAPMNNTYTVGELEHAFSLSKPIVCFASSQTISKINTVVKKLSYVKKVITFEDKSNYPNVEPYWSFTRNTDGQEDNNFICHPTDVGDNVSLILCSSGTTGLPKGVQLTQKNILVGGQQHFTRAKNDEEELCPIPILLSVIPWFHAYGILSLISATINGRTIVYLPKFEERYFLRAIEKFKVNTLFLVPPLMVFLAKSDLVTEFDLSSVKLIFSGAAPLSKYISDAVKNRFGISVIRQGYGMSEGSLSFTTQEQYREKTGSVGVLRSGLLGKVVDPETGRILGKYEWGEMCVKGSVIMKGYVNDDDATRNTIDRDGWLHTGDIAYFDDDGEWYIVDRLKELIKYKGFQVAPAEMEALLLTHSSVQDAAVIGIPEEKSGELPLAFIVKKPDKNLTESDIIDFVAANMSIAKRLHGGVVFLNSIPRNTSGKILRRELRDMVLKQKSKL